MTAQVNRDDEAGPPLEDLFDLSAWYGHNGDQPAFDRFLDLDNELDFDHALLGSQSEDLSDLSAWYNHHIGDQLSFDRDFNLDNKLECDLLGPQAEVAVWNIQHRDDWAAVPHRTDKTSLAEGEDLFRLDGASSALQHEPCAPLDAQSQATLDHAQLLGSTALHDNYPPADRVTTENGILWDHSASLPQNAACIVSLQGEELVRQIDALPAPQKAPCPPVGAILQPVLDSAQSFDPAVLDGDYSLPERPAGKSGIDWDGLAAFPTRTGYVDTTSIESLTQPNEAWPYLQHGSGALAGFQPQSVTLDHVHPLGPTTLDIGCPLPGETMPNDQMNATFQPQRSHDGDLAGPLHAPSQSNPHLTFAQKRTDDDVSTNNAGSRPTKRSKVRHVPSDMCFEFLLPGARHAPAESAAIARRARQAAINRMRRTRACCRCKILRLRCSERDPCDQCVRALANTISSKTLGQWRFAGCTREKLASVNPFRQEISYADISTTIHKIRGPVMRIHNGSEHVFPPDLSMLAAELSKNLAVYAYRSQVNVIGALMRGPCQTMLAQHLSESMCNAFATFLMSAALLKVTTSGTANPQLNQQPLQNLRDWASEKLFRQIDERLTPRCLSTQSLKSLSALYLVVYGTVQAVSSSGFAGFGEPCILEGHRTGGAHSPMSQLTNLLTQYLLFLESKISILRTGSSVRTILNWAESGGPVMITKFRLTMNIDSRGEASSSVNDAVSRPSGDFVRSYRTDRPQATLTTCSEPAQPHTAPKIEGIDFVFLGGRHCYHLTPVSAMSRRVRRSSAKRRSL